MAEQKTRLRFDIKEHCTVEQKDGSWQITFDHLGVSGQGSTEEEAWSALGQALAAHMQDTPDDIEKWKAYIAEHGVEEPIPEDELRARDELIERSHAASAGFRVVNADTFDEVIGSSTPTLVDFWAEWCGPCHMVAPVLKEVADELGERLEVAKVNMDDNKEFYDTLGIEGIPTMILFRDGLEKFRLVGAGRTKEQMIRELEPHLS